MLLHRFSLKKVFKEEAEVEIIIEGQRKCKISGIILDGYGTIEANVENRIKATRLLHTLKSVFLNTKEVSNQTKVRIVVPTLTYGSEFWVITVRVKSKIAAMKVRILKNMEGVARNETIRERLGVVSVVSKIEERQLSWFRHLIRMKDDNFVKVI